MPEFLGLPCVELKNEALSLLVTQSVGPRILSLRLNGGPNLFAEVPDFTLECPGGGTFRVLGGHRFWLAPEDPARTYRPDDAPVEIETLDRGLIATAPADRGLLKSIRIAMPDERARVVVDHTVTNCGKTAVTCAPWAITALRTGGVAILPQSAATAGVLPNRCWALWPYTDIRSPFIAWGNEFTLITAGLESGALKVGFPNRAGWLAYHAQGMLFVKFAFCEDDADYPDSGSSSECYANNRFLELETLGPLTELAPGRSLTHHEVWQVFEAPAFEPTEFAAGRMMAQFRLGRRT